MKIVTLTTLYPNSVQPHHGIFVENRLRHLLAAHALQSVVVAPVPWFPFTQPMFGRYAAFAAVPPEERRHGLLIKHPRYPLIPKVGMASAPLLLALALLPVLQRIRNGGYDFDLIDAHYFYPDGVAAVILGRWFKKPVIITARGSDINSIARFRWPRALIRWAANRAAGVVTVCDALRDRLIELGVRSDKIAVLRNGVDVKTFHPVNRDATRARHGLRRRTLLSVGHLTPLKGHHIAIEALTELVDVELLIAGEGEYEGALRQLAESLGVASRVRFLGVLPPHELKDYYGAVDALVLASSCEGWANVLLEAMACGTAVIATNVGGTPEVVRSPEAGVLMTQRTPGALAHAFRELCACPPLRTETRRYAERFGWEVTAAGQMSLFRQVLSGAASGP